MSIKINELRGEYKTELFYSHWSVTISVSRHSKKQKEEYNFIFQIPSLAIKLNSYTFYERNKKGVFDKTKWWHSYATAMQPNNMKIKDIPKASEIKKLVMDKLISGITFDPFKDAKDGVKFKNK
jgi:hypothetical protein